MVWGGLATPVGTSGNTFKYHASSGAVAKCLNTSAFSPLVAFSAFPAVPRPAGLGLPRQEIILDKPNNGLGRPLYLRHLATAGPAPDEAGI